MFYRLHIALIALTTASWLACAVAYGVESDPLPVPKGTPREHAVGLYNDGVMLMLQKHYAGAQQKFEGALALDDTLAEAHNNLAFSLRVQDVKHDERAMKHYERALQLKPNLAEAYVYRGALLVKRGDFTRARADHAKLAALNPKLAALLARIITGEAPTVGLEGLAAQYE